MNPEAFINATIAARAAELAANQTFYLSLGILIVLLAIGALLMFIFHRATELEHNINGMHVALVETTRKLALIEGNVAGRAELTAENKEHNQ